MSDAKNKDTPENHLEAARMRIRQVAEHHWKGIRQHAERLVDSVCLNSAHAQGAGRLLRTSRRCTVAIATHWEWTIDEVGDKARNTQIRSSLGELDHTDEIRYEWEVARHTSQSRQLFLGRLVLIVLASRRRGFLYGGNVGLLVIWPLGSCMWVLSVWSRESIQLAVVKIESPDLPIV